MKAVYWFRLLCCALLIQGFIGSYSQAILHEVQQEPGIVDDFFSSNSSQPIDYNAIGGRICVGLTKPYLFTIIEEIKKLETCCDVLQSKIDHINVAVSADLTPVTSQLDVCCSAIDKQLDMIDSKLDLPSCAATPITTTTTLSVPGVYCLANDIAGDVAITGTGITLDLASRTISGGTYGITISGDDVTVRNGTIKNATNANILLTGNQCLLASCDLIGSAIGMQMLNGLRNRVTDCCAMNATQAGFSLAQSFSNNIVGCQAMATTGTGATYGFVAQSGGQNSFEACKAQGTSSSGIYAMGFGLLGENSDVLSGNKILSTLATSSSGYAYGIFTSSILALITGVDYGDSVFSVNWSPNGQYLAVGGLLAGSQLAIYAFNGSMLTTVTIQSAGSLVNSAKWSPDGNYLAVGMDTDGVAVYSFDGSSLVLTASQVSSLSVLSVDWSPDGQFLAVGNYDPFAGHDLLEVYAFNGVSLLLTCSQAIDANYGNTLDWSPDGNYLAVGGAQGGNELGIYAFDGISLVLTVSQSNTAFLYSVNWSPDGQYLAVGSGISGQQLQLYTFTGTSSSLNLTLSQNIGNAVSCVNWSPDGDSLAIGKVGYPAVIVYAFNETSLLPIFSCNYGSTVYSVNWSSNGQYLAVGGNNLPIGNEVQIYKFFLPVSSFSSRCVIENNFVDSTHALSQTGMGYAVDASNNLFLDNTAYANDADYQFTTTSIGNGPVYAPMPITAATRISLPGAYCLANNINGDVIIDGSGITLDLAGRTISGGTYGITISGDDVTVRNGTIKNAASANLLITGNQCLIEGCDFLGSVTGIQVFNGGNNRICDCCALNNTSAGFSLLQSSGNNIMNCKALATSGTGATYGFIAQSGGKNIFENCKSEGTSSRGSSAVGFGVLRELNDIVSNNTILSTALTSTFGLAYGMLFLYQELHQVAQYDYGFVVYSANWSPDGKYLAIGGGGALSGNALQIYAFNGSSLVLIASKYFSSNALSVNWSPDGQHLAVGGNTSLGGNQVEVYAFNGTSLTLENGKNCGAQVYSVNWSSDGQYLAVGINLVAGQQLRVYEWIGGSLVLSCSQSLGANALTVDWSPDGRYIAAGTLAQAGQEIQVYSFDSSTSSLVLTTSQEYGNIVNSVSWSPDGQYLAIGGGDLPSDNEVQVYAFSSSASLLSMVASQEVGANVRSVAWSHSGNYLAAACYPGTDNAHVQVYTFDGTALVPFLSANFYDVSQVRSVDWSPYDDYLAVGVAAVGPNSIRVYGLNMPMKCVVQNNVVNGVHSSLSNGVGYSVDACTNLFVDNIAYANDIDYQFTSSCSGDNIYSQLDVIESKIDNGNDVITSQINDLENQSVILESKLDACCINMNSKIDWIVTYLMTH